MAELLVRYECPVCDKLHTHRFYAANCCEPNIARKLVCSICNESFYSRGYDRKRAAEHLKEHMPTEQTVEEKYFDLLRSGPVPFEVREQILHDDRTPERKLIDSVIFQEAI